MVPNSPCLLVFTSLCLPFHDVLGLVCMTNRIRHNDSMLFPRLDYKWLWLLYLGCSLICLVSSFSFSLSLSVSSLTVWKPAAMPWGHPGSLLQDGLTTRVILVVRNGGWLIVLWNALGGRLFDPSWALKWLQLWPTAWLQHPKRSWARTTCISHSWVPDSQKLYEIISVYCFKLLNFRAIC